MTNWQEVLNEESKKDYFIKLMEFINAERRTKTILPKEKDVFKAFKLTPLEKVKIVIIGQDPYPTENVPMGLAFSVNKDVKVPMSLRNIYQELALEFPNEFVIPSHGDLTNWAKKGVFLINQILTVEAGKPLSHKNKGWEVFTKQILNILNQQDRKIVYILWGNEAQKLKKYITNDLHLVLESSHPSPLSARVSFFGSNIFKIASDYLDLPKGFWNLE